MPSSSAFAAAFFLILGLISVNCQAAPTSGSSGLRIAAGGERAKVATTGLHRGSAARSSTAAGRKAVGGPSRSVGSRASQASRKTQAARANQAGASRAAKRTTRPDVSRLDKGQTRVTAGVTPASARVDRAGAVGAAAVSAATAAGLAGVLQAGEGEVTAPAASAAPAVSLGSALGLHRVSDPLALRSGTALVIDQESGEVLFEKNPQYVLPIASLTKLMTAMVVLDAAQSLDERIEVLAEDRDTDRYSASHLPVGARLTRRELLQLALMSSENRAAAALARSYPGGFDAYVDAANRKAAALGMVDSTFADGTGLSASNVATAHDLARMASAASRYPMIAEMSLAPSMTVRLPGGARNFHTTNRLVGSPNWELELQKTGYITEAGNCLLLQARVEDRTLIVVLLDSFGRYSRIGDAERIRRWLENPA